jgi:SAM-dependent methyltransferase
MENWNVYGKVSGKTEEEVVNRCLAPFYNKDHTCLEIGCGRGFWTNKYLTKQFKHVVALDLLPNPRFTSGNVTYIEVPDRDFTCYGVEDNSIDFCWSFGVFCHLSIPACREYVKAIYSKLKPGGKACLYFSNIDRRPGDSKPFDYENKLQHRHVDYENEIQWTFNDYQTTEAMLLDAGFIDVKDQMPDLIDTMISGQKPWNAHIEKVSDAH